MSRKKFARFAVLNSFAVLSLALAAGCDNTPDPGENPGTVVFEESNVTVTGTADFGTVIAGETKEATFTVTNAGQGSATLDAITGAGLGLSAPFSLTGGTCRTAQVLDGGAHQSCTLVVTYAPTDETQTSLKMTVKYRDRLDNAEQGVPVTITGTGAFDCDNKPVPSCPVPTPIVSVSEAGVYDYGTLTVSLGSEHVFTVTNTGRSDAILGDVSTSGLGLGAPFTVTGGTCATGATVAKKGGTCTIAVSFAPGAPAPFFGLIELRYSGENVTAATATRALTGLGALDCDNFPVPACPPPLPNIAFTDSVSSGYGQVNIGSALDATFTLTNRGRVDGALTDVSDAGLGLSGTSFSVVDGGTCQTGSVLSARGGSCTLKVRFTPEKSGATGATIVAAYSGTNGASSVTRQLTGTAVLNCQANDNLKGYYQQGVGAAQTDNANQAAAGAAAGAAAAYPTGHHDGYQATYPAAYASAYNQAYTAAYNAAYNGWYNSAYNQTCPNGTSAGAADGRDEGTFTGMHDGYVAGYNAAYAPAYTSGYNQGYSDGRNACYTGLSITIVPADRKASAFSARVLMASVADPTLDPTNDQLCYNQGYDATYSFSAYEDAYRAAVRSNPQYQVGYQDGSNQASSDAQSAAPPKGSADGATDAKNDGTYDGSANGYSQCYQSAYTSNYNSYYNSNYNSAYSTGTSNGDDDGYNAGYVAGYTVGESSCFTSLGAGAPSRAVQALAASVHETFGDSQTWMKLGPNGIRLDAFVQRPIRRGMQVKDLNRTLRNEAGTRMREVFGAQLWRKQFGSARAGRAALK